MNQYSSRRERVMKSLQTNAAVMLFSGKAPMRSEDEAYDFSVNRNFYYLTGLDREDMVLLMYTMDGTVREMLFILPYDERLARWVGGRMSKEEASQISGIEDVEDVSSLDDIVASIMNRSRKDSTFRFCFDFWHYSMDQAKTPAHVYAEKLKEKYPYLIMKDIYPVLTHLRLVKDEYEINCIRNAIHVTNLGIQQMMRASRPGIYEMQMEAVFDFVLKQSLCKKTAFKTIAASGKRATVLHYSDNDQLMGDGELFLCDLGATCEYYNADISRTFPVNRSFTPRQRELYEIVLNAQKIVEENARPGVRMRDLNQMVIDYYKEELPKHGLNEDVSEYYFHSCGHHLGLDTHDCDGGLGAVLEAGNVITNEPGLYITEEGIGIRIEDDLLITQEGAEVLSQEIMKDPDEIEAYMKGQH
ncbi:MAG: aminopeptidase P N-terminal domain-containing protein [Erysipelotrichaceae bacterium]|nr:aminopeptidase P N-terminal domain-containing protein [Erysipelotrichaceae bacterium]